MTRTIRFRAWDGKKMLSWEELGQTYEDDGSKEWMQYTGLEDKNGKEIYEGDIVRLYEWKDNPYIYKIHPNLFQIEWMGENGKPVFEMYSPDEMWGKTADGKERESDIDIDVFFSFNDDDEYEIIGNIYKNPELLKP